MSAYLSKYFMDNQSNNKLDCVKRCVTLFSASYNVTKIFFTILFSLCLLLSLISFIWDIDILVQVNTLLGLFALMLLSTKIRRESLPIYIFIGFLTISFLVSSFFVGRTDWRLSTPIHFILSGVGIAMILVRGYVYSWGGYIVFYSLAVYFFILMLTGVDGYSALEYCSFNGISMVMLLACISLYIILSMENKNIDLKPALFTLIISIWGIGRSGIVSSITLLLGLLFVRLRAKPKYIFNVIICILIVSLFYALSMLAMDYSILGNAIDHYIQRGGNLKDTGRWVMWTNYMNNLDVFRLIFGANVVKDPWPEGEINDYNYHNSFINLHLQTGFMGLVTMAIIIFALFKFYRTNQVFFFLLLALIIRSSTDIFIFFNRFDIIIYFFIFYFLKTPLFRAPHINPVRLL
jgi:hypothetical protein